MVTHLFVFRASLLLLNRVTHKHSVKPWRFIGRFSDNTSNYSALSSQLFLTMRHDGLTTIQQSHCTNWLRRWTSGDASQFQRTTMILCIAVPNKFRILIILRDMINPWMVVILTVCLSNFWQLAVRTWYVNHIDILDLFHQLSNEHKMQILNDVFSKRHSRREELTVTHEGILCLNDRVTLPQSIHYWFCLSCIPAIWVLATPHSLMTRHW